MPEGKDQKTMGEQVDEDSIDLLCGGDFENAVYSTAVDQPLKAQSAEMRHEFQGRSGHALTLMPDADAEEI